jgi:hypothetical protein
MDHDDVIYDNKGLYANMDLDKVCKFAIPVDTALRSLDTCRERLSPRSSSDQPR